MSTIRCSSLPRLAMCPASYSLGQKADTTCGLIPSGEAAQRGTDIHQQLAEIVNKDGIQGLQHASKNIGLDIAVRILAGRAWAAICDAELQDAEVWNAEMPVENYLLCLKGTADLVMYKATINRALVLDYKSGYATVGESAEHAQMLAYSTCVYATCDGETRDACKTILPPLVVFGRIVSACGKMTPPVRVDRNTINVAMTQLSVIVNDAMNSTHPKVYPGPHCTYCPAAGRTCDAFKATFSEALTTTEAIGQSLPSIPDANLMDAYLKLKQLAVLEDALTAEIKRRIVVNGQPCAGYTLKMRHGTTRLSGDGLEQVCTKYGIHHTELGVQINIKDIGKVVGKHLGVKAVDGLSLVEAEFGHLAVQGEPTAVLSKADEEAE